MSLRLLIEDLQGQASEFESQIEELGCIAEEHKDDVIFLYEKIAEALPHCNLEAYKILSQVGLYEFKAIEEKRKEEQR
ncbi:hypothetical protein F6Y03_31120 [Bacillus megaterium]|nr:hypothetical protein [Priestia megaterium]NGY84974.1 hypothetical protein [Priestia megaterium]